MFGGTKHTSYIGGVLLAACMFATGSASAADLGGGCCADLEERVAELEATTARKGNRVVSLQISGVVTQTLLAWDDGADSDTYVLENAYPSNYFNFRGEGKISPSTKAGFFVEVGFNGSSKTGTVDADNDESTLVGTTVQSQTVFIRHSYAYVENDKLGRITIGQTSNANDGITEIGLSKANIVRNGGAQLWTGSFRPVVGGDQDGRFRHRDFWGGNAFQGIGEGDRFDVIKYTSPSIAGFTASASWGENDMWDVALRYAGQWNSFRVAAGVGYQKWDDTTAGAAAVTGLNTGAMNCVVGSAADNFAVDCSIVGMSAAVMHVPTGLFAHASYGLKSDDNIASGGEQDSTSFYIQAGIEKNWFGVGPTTIFGEYQQMDSGRFVNGLAVIEGADTEIWGIGFNQNFASAALDLYVSFRNTSIEAFGVDNLGASTGPEGNVDFEDFQEVMAGARIVF